MRRVFTAEWEAPQGHLFLDSAIFMIFKGKKAPRNLPESYRPISLLNTDGKILTRWLANWLMPRTKEVVQDTQTGFIHNRSIFWNLRFIQDFLEILPDPVADRKSTRLNSSH